MDGALSWQWMTLAAAAAVAALLWPRVGARAQWRRHRELRERTLVEDALKHILVWEQNTRDATPESLMGALGVRESDVIRLIQRMEQAGLLHSAAGGLHLTPKGESLALHVVRAHRLWERYLADDARMPMGRLHQAAEKAEHQLSREAIEELDAHLGHPTYDPHGDPIPSSDGAMAAVKGVPLTDWPSDQPARIVHIEDEPDVLFKQIVAAGLRPGMTLRILAKDPERLVISDGESEHFLAPVVAANIHVAKQRRPAPRASGSIRLSDLKDLEAGEVVEIDSGCQGYSRRRLLDLGLTPGTRVEGALRNPFGEPRAFRVRGTTVALRSQQTDHIWVKPAGMAHEDEPSPKPAEVA
jgi:DtxR family Mn-dependent transcriptional regulator